MSEVVLANPYKTRMIADAQIKNDKVDAEALATLLRGNLIATAYAPSPATRARKHVIRQRMFWVRQRTMVRNRVHTLLARQRKLEMPHCSDPFEVDAMDFDPPVTGLAPMAVKIELFDSRRSVLTRGHVDGRYSSYGMSSSRRLEGESHFESVSAQETYETLWMPIKDISLGWRDFRGAKGGDPKAFRISCRARIREGGKERFLEAATEVIELSTGRERVLGDR